MRFLPSLPSVNCHEMRLLLGITHVRAVEDPSATDGSYPPPIYLSAIEGWFPEGGAKVVVASLIESGLLSEEHDAEEDAVSLSEAGVQFIYRAGLIPAGVRRCFGDFDDFGADMDELDAMDEEKDAWAKTHWSAPHFIAEAGNENDEEADDAEDQE